MQIILKESAQAENFPNMEQNGLGAVSTPLAPLPPYPTPEQKGNFSSSLHRPTKANVDTYVTIQSLFSSAIETHSLNI